MPEITISDARDFAIEHGKSVVVIITNAPGNLMHVTTYGRTKELSKLAASLGNGTKELLGWPEELCNAEPLERICENCTHLGEQESIPTTQPIHPCYIDPQIAHRSPDDQACERFYGKNWDGDDNE